MQTLLVILMILITIAVIARIVFVSINKNKNRSKVFGILSSLVAFLPVITIFAKKSFYFSEIESWIMILALSLLFLFFLLICFLTFAEYKDCIKHKNDDAKNNISE